MNTRALVGVFAAVMFLSARAATGQPREQQVPPDERLGRAAAGRDGAVIDLTGNWVSVITEDWRWRMLTPPKGDYSGVPLNIEGRKVSDLWDPARDEAAGERCRAYGAAAIMRQPTRLRIAWQDDLTLRIETDYGSQIRLLHFGASGRRTSSGRVKAEWQGHSSAEWEGSPATTVKIGSTPGGPRDLKVVTTGMRAGYLRKNGIPYSEHAVLSEYYDLMPKQPNGDQWLVVTSVVDDPTYLTEPFITSSHFKKEANASGWHPTACSAR